MLWWHLMMIGVTGSCEIWRLIHVKSDKSTALNKITFETAGETILYRKLFFFFVYTLCLYTLWKAFLSLFLFFLCTLWKVFFLSLFFTFLFILYGKSFLVFVRTFCLYFMNSLFLSLCLFLLFTLWKVFSCLFSSSMKYKGFLHWFIEINLLCVFLAALTIPYQILSLFLVPSR